MLFVLLYACKTELSSRVSSSTFERDTYPAHAASTRQDGSINARQHGQRSWSVATVSQGWRGVQLRRRSGKPLMLHPSPALSLTLFPEIGGQFNIRRAEVLRGRELCGIRMLPNFQTVETTDIRVQQQQFMPRLNIVQDGGMAWFTCDAPIMCY